MARVGYWNHNVHYQPVILAAAPAGCGTAPDVGCGDGMLACKLAERCAEVTGIDRDARMIAVARARARAREQEHELPPGRLLPGVRYRRHLLWRYSLLWRKPE